MAIVYLQQQRRLQAIASRQETVEQIQFLLHPRRLAQAGDAQHFLQAEPQRLPILKEKRQRRADADAAIAVEVAAVGGEELTAAGGVFVQRQYVVQRQRLHRRDSVPFSGGKIRFTYKTAARSAPRTGPPMYMTDSANQCGLAAPCTVASHKAGPNQRAG